MLGRVAAKGVPEMFRRCPFCSGSENTHLSPRYVRSNRKRVSGDVQEMSGDVPEMFRGSPRGSGDAPGVPEMLVVVHMQTLLSKMSPF